MNRVEICGGLPREPELKALPSGMFVCEFTVAVREAFWSGKDREEKVRTNFIGCVAWADLAQYVGEHFHKRDEVYVVGQLTQEEYESSAGKKQSKTKVRVLQISPVRRAASYGPVNDDPEPDF